MRNFRNHGKAPFKIAVIHGGPGAVGSMAPVAKRISLHHGVIEPLQTKTSISSQIRELKTILEKEGELPVVLIGHSWGAWLSILFAVQHPSYVKKLILVSSGPIDEKYASVMDTRLSRLDDAGKKRVQSLVELLNNPKTKNKEIKQWEKFIVEVDSYHPTYYEKGQRLNVKVFKKVWTEASKLRKSGKLLNLCSKIKCPITAIHGDFDPHPYQGIKKPLSATIKKPFKFILLKKCGHTPWIEKEAREIFYKTIKKELSAHENFSRKKRKK